MPTTSRPYAPSTSSCNVSLKGAWPAIPSASRAYGKPCVRSWMSRCRIWGITQYLSRNALGRLGTVSMTARGTTWNNWRRIKSSRAKPREVEAGAYRSLVRSGGLPWEEVCGEAVLGWAVSAAAVLLVGGLATRSRGAASGGGASQCILFGAWAADGLSGVHQSGALCV